jgi:hypothetical protein
MSTNNILARDIENATIRLGKLLNQPDADLNQIRIECDTLSQLAKKFIPEETEDLGATQNPVLMYDATVTLEFLPDGEQVLRVALADQTEPVLINKRGDESFEGDEWQHHTNLANKWLQIDYHITTHKED